METYNFVGSKFICDIEDLVVSREVGGLTWKLGLKWAPEGKLQHACVLVCQPDGPGVQIAHFENGRWTIEAPDGPREIDSPDRFWWTIVKFPISG